jgi:hypothetical protein
MATKPNHPPGLSTTLAKMRESGVRRLIASCLNDACGHEITFSADEYADEIEVSWFAPRMICAKCSGEVDVRPTWKEQPTMPTNLRFD